MSIYLTHEMLCFANSKAHKKNPTHIHNKHKQCIQIINCGVPLFPPQSIQFHHVHCKEVGTRSMVHRIMGVDVLTFIGKASSVRSGTHTCSFILFYFFFHYYFIVFNKTNACENLKFNFESNNYTGTAQGKRIFY